MSSLYSIKFAPQGRRTRLIHPDLRTVLHGLDIDRVLDLYNALQKDEPLGVSDSDVEGVCAVALYQVHTVKSVHGTKRLSKMVQAIMLCHSLGLRPLYVLAALAPSRVTACLRDQKPSDLARLWVKTTLTSCELDKYKDNSDYLAGVRNEIYQAVCVYLKCYDLFLLRGDFHTFAAEQIARHNVSKRG